MAVRREKIRAQFTEAITPTLEPGETIVAGTMGQTGPSPWLIGAIGVLVMWLMGMRPYWLAVTDRRVIFWRASMMSARPKALGWADPRGAGEIKDAVVDAKVWNSFKYLRPTGETVRFNVSRVQWKDEYQAVMAELMTPPAPPMPSMP